VTGQVNVSLQAQFPDLAFESEPLRPLPDDPAEEVEPLFAENRAGSDEKVVILYLVQPPDGE
jgi:hypothetical protein